MKQPSLNWVDKHYAVALKHLPEFADAYMDDDKLRRFALLLRSVCHMQRGVPFKNISADALWESVEHLKGKLMTPALIKRNTLRVIANWHFIEDGMEIPMWDGGSCVTDVVFIGVTRVKTAEGSQPKMLVRLKLKTGLCAGIIHDAVLSVNKVGYFLDHVGGVGRYHCNVEEISGMQARLTVYYEGHELFIREWRCTDPQKVANRRLTDARTDVAKCTRSQPCNVCSADITQCKLAVWLPRKEQKCQINQKKPSSTSSE